MRRKLAWTLIVIAVILTATGVVVGTKEPYDFCLRLAVREIFQPTTVDIMPLSFNCSETQEAIPDPVQQIIEAQKSSYNLVLQNVKTCRTRMHLPQQEPEFTEAAFAEATRRRWLPAYIGCCTYSFRRHFAVVVTKPDAQGDLIVVATLIQSRWTYLRFLRLHCDQKLRVWL
jgi:hypothetical protein